ncbi:hypothetical protein [Spiroplasma endosymbiont of Zeiraphera isertana]|uniref:hypothetical protein n=1 Tax=Spiroplasma endosymbiont of Zeiraphera isertana TaxID=3066313 RepID=UPI00313D5211
MKYIVELIQFHCFLHKYIRGEVRILIKSGIFNLPGKKDLTKNKGTNNNLLAIDATETPIERIKKN